MPDDLDHEVIDSPQALFRHLYEAHGLVEALDLDPATAPLQFWLRKHAELERATARAGAHDRMAAAPERMATAPERPPAPGHHLLPGRSAAQGRSAGLSLGTPTAAPATPSPAGRGGAARGSANPGATTAPGPRFRPFADPLVEAIAAALVARGLDERQVRRGLSTFTGVDGRHGEEAVRAAFIAPMLEALTAQLAGGPPRRARPAQPAGGVPSMESAAPRAPAAARAGSPEPDHGAWVAQPLVTGPEPDVDYMAIADVLQERRRSRRGGRREAATPPRTTPPRTPPPATPPPATPPPRTTPPASGAPSRAEPDDDYMALADALQRRRGKRPR